MKLDPKSFGCGVVVGFGLSFFALLSLSLAGLVGYLIASEATVARALPVSIETTPVQGAEVVTEGLQEAVVEHGMPGMAAALVTSDGLQHLGVAGVRKRGEDVPVSVDDLWHLGSNTKAMTATLIALLVERGQLEWNTSMKEVFPEFADNFHPAMRDVTVEQLLSHRAGLPANLRLRRYQGEDVRALRRRVVQEYLGKRPLDSPGERMNYSNLGYILAGAVVEQILDTTWEDAMRTEVFEPLGMSSAGFGGTGTPGVIDQPWPHRDSGRPAPQNGPDMDNPPVMGPAGRVHCSMADWAKFIQDQLRGARGQANTLLQAESYAKLHTPPEGGDYALGWLVTEREWGSGTVLHHSGDNTMNRANVWIAPKRNFAVMACANQGGDKAHEATDDAVSQLIRLVESEPTDR